MIAAFGRLFSILIFSLLAVSFTLFGLRYLGSGQIYAPIEHPLLEPDFVWVGETKEEPHWQHWRLRLNAGRKWQKEVNGKMQDLPDAPAQSRAGLWLEVIDPTSSDKLAELSSYVKKHNLEKSVVFSSTYQGIGRDMRKLEPLWLYGSSVAESARTRLFTSLFLETIASIDSDIVVVEKINSSRLTEELRKRHKKLFILLRSRNDGDLAAARELKSAQMIDGAIIAP